MCEAHGVHYVFGLARNRRLEASIADEMAEIRAKAAESGKPERIFKELLPNPEQLVLRTPRRRQG